MEYVRSKELCKRLGVSRDFIRRHFDKLPPPAVIRPNSRTTFYSPQLCAVALSYPDLFPEVLETAQQELIGVANKRRKNA